MDHSFGHNRDDGPRQPRWAAIVLLGLLAAGVAALVWWLPDALDTSDRQAAFVSRLLILVLVVSGAAFHFRGRLHHAALQALAWAGIFVVLILGYSFRAEFAGLGNRLLGELVPHRATASGEDSVAIRAAADGHFHVEAEVDGTRLRFMVDTGATGIALSRRDAERLGIDRRQLRFTQPVQTANGMTMVAPVHLQRVAIGPIVVRDIGAYVSDNLAGASLLGMSFLNRLSGYTVDNGVLTLRR